MNTKRYDPEAMRLALLLGIVWAGIACTRAQLRTTRDIGAGTAGLACAVAGEAKGRPWASMLAAVGCGLEALLERRGSAELAPVRRAPLDAALAKCEATHAQALESGTEADTLAAHDAWVEADALATEAGR